MKATRIDCWNSIVDAPKDRTILGRALVEGNAQYVFIRWHDGRQDWVHADGGPEYTAYSPELWIEAPAECLRRIEALTAPEDEY